MTILGISASLTNQIMATKTGSIKILGSVIIVGLALFVAFRLKSVSFTEVYEALSRLEPTSVALALIYVLGQILCMVARIWCLFPNRQTITFMGVAHAITVGQFVNTFLPARAGDVLKVMMLNRKDSPSSVSMLTGAGVVASDKLVDMGALFLLIAFSKAYLVPGFAIPTVPTWVITLVAAVMIAVCLALWLTQRQRNPAWISNLRSGFAALAKPTQLILSLSIGLCAWSFEALAIQVLVDSLGTAITFTQSVFVLTVLNLAIAVPISFANLGTFEASIVFALGTFGVAIPEAIAIATTHHLLQYVGIIIGAGFTTWEKRLHRADRTHREFKVSHADKDKAIAYFDKVSRTYDETVSRGILRIPRDLERKAMLQLAELDGNGKTMIDVGCGAGFYALVAKEADMAVTAVDASPGMVERLKGKVEHAFVVDIDTMPTDKTYDRVVCAGVLDFVLHPETAFRNLCRLVAPGGRLVILCPRKGPGGFLYRIEKFFFGVKVNLFTADWLKAIAESEGLQLRGCYHPLPTNMTIRFDR